MGFLPEPFSHSHRDFSPVSESALEVVNRFNVFTGCSN